MFSICIVIMKACLYLMEENCLIWIYIQFLINTITDFYRIQCIFAYMLLNLLVCLFSDFCQENSLSFEIDEGDTNKH